VKGMVELFFEDVPKDMLIISDFEFQKLMDIYRIFYSLMFENV